MEIWSFIVEKIQAGQAVILLVVVESKGSSPGRQGFKMALAADGDRMGTIGGGIMEHRMMERAAELLRGGAQKPVLVFQNHRPDAAENASGMMCMGNQRIAFMPLYEADIAALDQIATSLESKQPGFLYLSSKGLSFQAKTPENGPVFQQQADRWQYRENIGDLPCLYVFGAGHVSLALCRQFSLLGFRIYLFDDRPDLALFTDNTYAWRKEVVDYRNVGHLVPEGQQVYVIIMTAAHESDGWVLGQMLGKDLRYLGMLGSKGKARTLFGQFRERGVPEAQLEFVSTPIGLPIRSKTPEEIAVSIAAEVIQVKNEGDPRKRY